MKYKVIKNFIDVDACNQLVERLDMHCAAGWQVPFDTQCPESPSFYGIFNDELLLWLPKIEKLLDKKLFPTYTYSRIYKRGSILLPHVDRGECEYSFTLSLKHHQDIWPIYLQTDEGIEEVNLDVGDILIYKGTEVLHWRMPLQGEFQYQGFFHYVDQNGPYSCRKYDNRVAFQSTHDAVNELLRKRNVL